MHHQKALIATRSERTVPPATLPLALLDRADTHIGGHEIGQRTVQRAAAAAISSARKPSRLGDEHLL
jgi:hypothetical protein